jgi:zinc transporter ZupT
MRSAQLVAALLVTALASSNAELAVSRRLLTVQAAQRQLLHSVGKSGATNQDFIEGVREDNRTVNTYLLHKLRAEKTPPNQQNITYLLTKLNLYAEPNASSPATQTQLTAESLVTNFAVDGAFNSTGMQQVAVAVLACEIDENCSLKDDPTSLTTTGSTTSSSDGDSNGAKVVKWVGTAVLFIEALLGVLLALLVKTKRSIFQQGSWFLSALNTFAAGVFLTFGIMHFLPDSAAASDEVVSDFPLAYFFVVLAFMVLLAIQRIVSPLLGTAHAHNSPVASVPSGCCSSVDKEASQSECSSSAGCPCSKGGVCMCGTGKADPSALCTNCACSRDPSPQTAKLMGASPCEAPGAACAKSQPQITLRGWRVWLTPLILTLGIILHGAIEGISLGLQTEKAGAVTVLVAMVSHKWVESVALAGRIVALGGGIWATLILLVPFAAIFPVGVAIGNAISDVSPWVDLVFFSLLTGAFIYIAFEIVLEELSGPLTSSTQKLRRFACYATMFAGFVLVALLQLVHSS